MLTLSLVLALAPSYGLQAGTPELASAGALAFGPDGVLFVADPAGAAIFAIDVGAEKVPELLARNVEAIDARIAAKLGTTKDAILVNDLAVHPANGDAYLSVSRGRGPDAAAVIVRVDAEGELHVLSLEDVKFSKALLPNAPGADTADRRGRSMRGEAITDMHYVDGRLIVAGLSNEEFASKLRTIPFPFADVSPGTSVEIYHGAHGAWETRAPVRTFLPYEIEGEEHVLAAYTCTPLVKFPVSELSTDGAKVRGVTIAELGNRNRPIDIIRYKKDGKEYLLMANSSRGVMKFDLAGIEQYDGITEHVPNGGKRGLPYETIDWLEGVMQLDRLDDRSVVVLVEDADAGVLNLLTVETP